MRYYKTSKWHKYLQNQLHEFKILLSLFVTCALKIHNWKMEVCISSCAVKVNEMSTSQKLK